MEDDSNPRRRLLQQLAVAAAGGFTAPQESLPPLLRSNPEPLAGAGTLYPVLAGEVGVVVPEYPYGHGSRYGIKADGTDTTAEVKNWRDSIVGMGFYSDAYGLQHPRCKAVLPAGSIRIREAGALLKLPNEGPQLWGYTIEGEGWRSTSILYDPEKPGPLMFASNRVFGLTIRNLHFCTPDPVKERCDWLLSQSSGKQYMFTFENLAFDGFWRGGVRISAVPGDPHGGDTNSEMKFDRITIGGGGFKDGLVVDSPDDALQSGQFLNYWFSNICTGMWAGLLVKLHRGGHINFFNLDVSGYKPTEESWLIDLPEISDSDSKHSLTVRNARFECLSGFAKFLRCRWERGTVLVDGYDDVHPWRGFSDPRFEIRASNSTNDPSFGKSGEGVSSSSAQYWFANARFSGAHLIIYRGTPGNDADNIPATIQYQNCEFCGPKGERASENIHSFVRLVPEGGKSSLLRPHVRFRACRVEAAPSHVTDWDLGIQGPHPSTTAPIKALRFGTNDSGRLPSDGAISMRLPPGATVLRVTWIAPGGRAPKRPYRFELSNGYDGDRRQLLAVFAGDDFSAQAGRVDVIAHETITLPLPEGFDPIRASTLVLRETRGPGVHPSAQCIVEFI